MGSRTRRRSPRPLFRPAERPHLFASDFAPQCLFYVLQIGHDVIVDPITERRRLPSSCARAAMS
jgi:hypothetical protein